MNSNQNNTLTTGAENAIRKQILVNQFVMTAGCRPDQAEQLLEASNWEFQIALSKFFQESAIPSFRQSHQAQVQLVPANTPATPPSFPDALSMFSKLNTGTGGSPYATSPMSAKGSGGSHLAQSPKQSFFSQPIESRR